MPPQRSAAGTSDIRFQLRMTADEKARLTLMAAKQRITLSELVRRRVLGRKR